MAVELLTKGVIILDAPALVPMRPQDIERAAKAVGKVWRTTLRGPRRSRPQENWYRKLVRVVADGIEKHPQTLHNELKYLAGKVAEVLTSPVFGMAVRLKSSSEMDDHEYQLYVREAEDIIFRDYLPGVDRKAVHDEVNKLADAAW